MTQPRFDTYLQVRLTSHDKERIKARALEAGLKTSEYVRKRALGERIGVSPPHSKFTEENWIASSSHSLP